MNSETSHKWLHTKRKQRSRLLRNLYGKSLRKSGRFALLLIIGIVVAVFLISYIGKSVYRSLAGENDVNVEIVPNKQALNTGEEMLLNVRFNTANIDKKISAINLVLDYDYQLFEYLPNTLTQLPINYFDDTVKESVQPVESTTKNRLQVSVTAKKGDHELTNSIQLTLKFRAKANGIGAFSVNQQLSEVVGTDNNRNPIEYTIVSGLPVIVHVGGVQYVREGYITSDGKELWTRECPIEVSIAANNPISTNYALCSSWQKTVLTNLIPSVREEQTYSSYGTYLFKDKNNRQFVKETIHEMTGKHIWSRNCLLDLDGRLSNCTNWKSDDITIMQNPAGYDGFIEPFENPPTLTTTFLNKEGNNMWTGFCPILLEDSTGKLAGEPNVAACQSNKWSSLNMYMDSPELTGKTFTAYATQLINGLDNVLYFKESLIEKNGAVLWSRLCKKDSEAVFGCSAWISSSISNLRNVGNESYIGYSSYIFTKLNNSGPQCTDDTSCGPNAVCQTNQTCACKQNYFNCDGDWGNGCEQANSCSLQTSSVRLKLKFQGITQQPKEQLNNLRVRVELKGPRSSQVAYGNFQAPFTNVWEAAVIFENVLPGDGYELLVKGPKHLQRKICDEKPTETEETPYKCDETKTTKLTIKNGENIFDFSGIYMWAGDLPFDGTNQNGIIDSVDFTYIRRHFTNTDAEAIHTADLNLDGFVGAQDHSLPVAVFKLEKNSDEE